MTTEPSPRLQFYAELARWWPLVSPVEDYTEEANEMVRVLHATDPRIRTVLELGAGGGHNAFHMKRAFELTLTDLSDEMLAVSRAINPECEHIVADMRTLDLSSPTCSPRPSSPRPMPSATTVRTDAAKADILSSMIDWLHGWAWMGMDGIRCAGRAIGSGVIVVALGLNGCGSSDSDSGTTDADGPTTTAATESTATAVSTSGQGDTSDTIADDQGDDPTDDQSAGNTSPCVGGASYEPETIPDGVVGVPYDQWIEVMSPAGWNVDTYGDVPAEIAIDSTGGRIHVHGVPQTAGVFEFTAYLDNGDGGQCGEAHAFGLIIAPSDDASSTSESEESSSASASTGTSTGG